MRNQNINQKEYTRIQREVHSFVESEYFFSFLFSLSPEPTDAAHVCRLTLLCKYGKTGRFYPACLLFSVDNFAHNTGGRNYGISLIGVDVHGKCKLGAYTNNYIIKYEGASAC